MSDKPIMAFKGYYRFLSNFYPARIFYAGEVYRTNEHAYQAAKSSSVSQREMIQKITSPGKAKRIGNKLILREDWESIKLETMRYLVRQKFFNHSSLAKLLVETGDREIIEGNTWNDTYWGMCKGYGDNHMGKILMEVRADVGKPIL